MLILYTTQSWSTAGEVISTSLLTLHVLELLLGRAERATVFKGDKFYCWSKTTLSALYDAPITSLVVYSFYYRQQLILERMLE